MTCDHVREELSAYVDDDLPLFRRQKVEAHLAVCRDCQGELQRWQKTVRVLTPSGPLAPPPNLLPGFHAALSRHRQATQRTHRRWMGGLASLILIGILSVCYLTGYGVPRKAPPSLGAGEIPAIPPFSAAEEVATQVIPFEEVLPELGKSGEDSPGEGGPSVLREDPQRETSLKEIPEKLRPRVDTPPPPAPRGQKGRASPGPKLADKVLPRTQIAPGARMATVSRPSGEPVEARGKAGPEGTLSPFLIPAQITPPEPAQRPVSGGDELVCSGSGSISLPAFSE